MTHQMQLQPEPFSMIKSGVKTIELRLYDEKRRKIRIGDEILFTNTENGETLAVKVLDLYVFDSFEELYKTLPLLQCGYTEQDIDSASPDDMELYYPKEKQKEYGVVGITIALRSAEFLSYYRLKEELVQFCRANGLPTSGGKQELNERIACMLSGYRCYHAGEPETNHEAKGFGYHERQYYCLNTIRISAISFKIIRELRLVMPSSVGSTKRVFKVITSTSDRI